MVSHIGPSAHSRLISVRSALLVSAVAMALPNTALAQGAPAQGETVADSDVIVVTGELSRSIENSLAAKRNLSVIGDAIIGDEIGDLPDLSVAETLERVVGVTSDRFKGGASELSIRGLGAFLGASFINGREVTSGSDGRDVNFGQFPSELINGAVVYKSQQASFIEGGVSGIIELQTLRPLDFGKRRLQVQGLVGYSDYEDRVVDGQPLSYRATLSYIDQYETGLGDIGLSIGAQIRRDTSPEDIFTTSSTFNVCNTNTPTSGGNCSFNANPGPDNTETYFVSNQYIYRALRTDSDRDAVMAGLQWEFSPNLELNIDAQYSFRSEVEERNNLIIAEGRRRVSPIEISENGALLAFAGQSRVELNPLLQNQDEEYLGGGINLEYTNDRLTIAGDVGYSQTERRRDELDLRIRTPGRVNYELDFRGVEVPSLTFTNVSGVPNFDLNNFEQYTDALRARRRGENVDDDIFSLRLDATYEDVGAFSSVQVGVRYADRKRVRDDGIDRSTDDGIDPIIVANDISSQAVIDSRLAEFPVRDFFEGANTTERGLTFASFDPEAFFLAVTGDPDAGLPIGSTLSIDDADIQEVTYAGYVQGNLQTELFGLPVDGNFGVRAIRTEVSSRGVSQALLTGPGSGVDTFAITPVGPAIVNTETNDFWSILPSGNLAFYLEDDVLLRVAGYRAIARPDPEGLSAALDIDDESSALSIGDAISASGNPFLEPLASWNADLSLEWYASRTSSVAVAAYYKALQTGFETEVSSVNLVVNDVVTAVPIARTINSDDQSRIFGFEVNVQHKFDFGIGFQASYNFADSNFEFPDPSLDASGIALADFTDPANIAGFSKHSANGTIFYENGPFNARVAYKWRSEYSRPFRSTSNRFAADQGFLDFSTSLNVTRNIQLRAQALNLLDEPNLLFRPTVDSPAQADFSGRRFFVGVRARI